MASITPRGDRFQCRIVHKNLPKPHFETFDTFEEAQAYDSYIKAMLDRGEIPLSLQQKQDENRGKAIKSIIIGFKSSAPGPAPTDLATLALLEEEHGDLRTTELNAVWIDHWVRRMKLTDNLAPSTIRKRVESLARAIDWHIRQESRHGQMLPANPLRFIPKGYSLYTAAEAAEIEKRAEAGEKVKVKKDRKKDLRFRPGDEQRIRDALSRVKAEGRRSPLKQYPMFPELFELIINTGMRLKEAYRMRCEWYDQADQVIYLNGSKGWRGGFKPRIVPVVKALRPLLEKHCIGKAGLMFPFWSGDETDATYTTNKLSHRFKSLFKYANMDPEFVEHDLRHEATCRWVTMRSDDGTGWMYRDSEICILMGWKSMDMYLHYASLRARDLSGRLG